MRPRVSAALRQRFRYVTVAVLFVACLGVTSVLLPTQIAQGREASPRPPAYSALDYVIGLNSPMATAWLPHGRMLVSQANGDIRLVEHGRLASEAWAAVPQPRVDTTAGLMGIAVDPQFATQPYVYVYYQRVGPDARVHNVLMRLRDTGQGGVVDRVLLDIATTAIAQRIGGAVHFGPDGLLYVVGSGIELPARFSDLENRAGLLFRITRDGTAPAGNPFQQDADVDPRLYAFGMRDPGDFTWSSRSGDLLVTDRDDAGRGYVRVVQAGDNVGAPKTGEPVRDGLEPVEPAPFAFSDAAALAGIESYGGHTLPASRNDVFVCVVEDGSLRHLFVDPTRPADSALNEEVLGHACGADLSTGPDGNLYFVDTAMGRVRVLRPESEVH